jgi:hypothetical protein
MVTNSDDKPPSAHVDDSKRRGAPETDSVELNVAAQALLASIEESARPKELAAAFPRIVNHMASLWRTPRPMNRYFEQLLTDTRGVVRKGFSLGILMELTTLKDYYQTKVFPGEHNVWDSAEDAEGHKF